MTDPIQVLGELRELVSRLDNASKEIYKLEEEFARAEELYEDTYNDLLTALIDGYEDEGKRMPGEDVRNAKVTKKMREAEPLLFGQYRRLRSELKRKQALARTIEREIFARQSDLSYLKTEVQATA